MSTFHVSIPPKNIDIFMLKDIYGKREQCFCCFFFLFPKVFKFGSGLRSGLLIAAGHMAVTFLSQILNSVCAASFLARDGKVGCHSSVL